MLSPYKILVCDRLKSKKSLNNSVTSEHLTQVTCSLSSLSSVFPSFLSSAWKQRQSQNLKPNLNHNLKQNLNPIPLLGIHHTLVATTSQVAIEVCVFNNIFKKKKVKRWDSPSIENLPWRDSPHLTHIHFDPDFLGAKVPPDPTKSPTNSQTDT